MSKKLFQGKYRIESIRLKGWDYASDGHYFVTICTKDREEFFGQVANEKMILNKIGKITANEWRKTEIIRPNIKLDEWVIMPNHIHGIVVIDNGGDADRPAVTPRNNIVSVETPRRGVSTTDNQSRGVHHNPHHNPEWKPNSLSSTIGQFKSICTKRIREIRPDFAWQSRFYDHIIRNDHALNNIRQYIRENPEKWWRDRNNNPGLFM
jgi:putative transposase